MNPTITVIVPIYNAEKFLKRCLDSLEAQTFKDFEVILVDDGSPDNSGIICEEYVRQDSRFRVIHKKNGGVASARQCGIDNARGVYSIHCDPDDWVEPDWLERLYVTAKNNEADISFSDFYYENPTVQTNWHYKYNELDNISLLHYMLNGEFHVACWNKLIRTSLYTRYDISFEPEINYGEDLLVMVKLFARNVVVSYTPKPLYHYNKMNDNSLTAWIDRSKVDVLVVVAKHINTILPHFFIQDILNFKIKVKGYMWSTQKYTNNELTSIFPEVNSLIIEGNKNGTLHGYSQLALFLRGYHLTARVLHLFTSTASSIYIYFFKYVCN